MRNTPARRAVRIGPLVVFLGCTVACLDSSLAAGASPEGVVQRLNELVSENRFAEAYGMAQQNLEYHEGDPEFDFLLGLAALEVGDTGTALFAFERLAFEYPEQQRVKLELARALLQSGNYSASRQLFNEVLASSPTENVRANIETYLALVDSREKASVSSFDWHISTAVGSDSNINSATELGVISTPIGDVELNPDGQSLRDEYTEIAAGMTYVRPFSKTASLNLSASLSRHDNLTSDQFDIDVLSGELSYARLVDDMRISYGLRAQRAELDENPFQNSASIITSLQRTPGDGWSQSLTGAYSAVRFDEGLNANAGLRDVNQLLLSGMLGKTISNFYHAISVYYGDEQALRSAGGNNAQTFYGIAFSEQIQLLPQHIPYFRLSLHRSDNKQNDPIFNVQRADEIFSTSVGWIWRANPNINVTTDVTYTTNDSNLELYEYERVKYQTGLRYQF